MPTYNPTFSLSSAPGITGHLYGVVAEATSPNVPVANTGQLAPPHNSGRQLSFTGLNPVIHIFTLYETNGIATTGTIRLQFRFDPQFPGVEIRADLWIKAGTTPGFAVGDNKYVDPDDSLEGWDYTLDIPGGIGPREPDQDYTQDSENNPTLTDPDYQTQDGERWVFRFQPKAITYNPTANDGGSALFSGEMTITADTALTNDEVGNIFLLASATSKLVVTLPDIETVGTRKILPFLSEGGSHINAVLECFTGQKIKWKGDELTEIAIGQCELIHLYKWVNPDDDTDVAWRVLHADTGCRTVGEKIYLDEIPDATDEKWRNCLLLDGRELDRDVYPRLWEYASQLGASLLVSEATWNTATDGVYTHKGKFSTGDGSTTFRIPLYTGIGFLRGVDGSTRLAGSYEAPMLLDHKHEETVGTLPSSLFGIGATNRLIGRYNGTGTGKTDLTSSPVKTDGTAAIASLGSNNSPANIAQYCLIRV